MAKQKKLIPSIPINSVIHTIRGKKVILAADLAIVYGVETRVLNQAVKRNKEKFPDDFMFQLTREEAEDLQRSRSQSVILKRGANIKYLPYAFTEHGAVMAANILKSQRAIQMSIFVVRAFVQLREIALTHRELTEKLKELERKVGKHDEEIKAIIEAIRQLMRQPEKPKREIGFRVKERKVRYAAKHTE